ncbi:MAG: zinc-dependent alcohol dehydrogenase family protein [Bacteroidota bacterium]
MKALVYHGPGKQSFDEKAKPSILAPTDAIVRITATTICGTDLHIMKGDVPTVTAGRILGHEGVGLIEEIGANVTNFRIGNPVLLSCITSCGKCGRCRERMYSHCEHGGWVLGNTIDGTQAEYVRIPHADTSMYHIPNGSDEEAMVMLSDILPTGFECGVLNGKITPGNTVAIVGAGPIGLATLLTAQFYSPSEIIMVDTDQYRLDMAVTFGATKTFRENAVESIMKYTNGRGVDVAVEAVGIPETFAICESIVAAGGHIANIGVHGKSVELHLEKLWSHNVTITTGLVDTSSTSMLLKIVRTGALKPRQLITHHFRMDEIVKAYTLFGNAGIEKALKVIITN